MIPRLYTRCLLTPGDLVASSDDLVVVGAFNPGVAVTPAGVVLMIRVAEAARNRRPGYVGLPRWNTASGAVEIDWAREDEVTFVDPRVVRLNHTGTLRLTCTSHLRIAHSSDGTRIDTIAPEFFVPSSEIEEFGIEDPRITCIDDRYFVTYVAVSRHGVATALASTDNFRTFDRHGIVFCTENKDVVVFPEKIGMRYYALHRPVGAHAFSAPEIWLASSPNLINWGEHTPVLGSTGEWDAGRIGAGTPPIRTPHGWLEIYHGNDYRPDKTGIGVYSAGAVLLSQDDPRRVLQRKDQVLVPQREFELNGFSPGVVFPTGIIDQGETIQLYYGAADTATAMVQFRLADVLGLGRFAGAEARTLLSGPQ